MPKVKVVICPYCGDTQPSGDRCRHCKGLFEPLSRQATHNAMGPWFVRDPNNPFQPGCSYETLVKLIDAGRVSKYTIIRGPTTKQFWTIAKHTPGVAHLLGYCHHCDAAVNKKDLGCPQCGAPFGAYLDRNFLGLPEVKPMPGDVDPSDTSPGQWTAREVLRPTAPGLSSFGTDEELMAGGSRFEGVTHGAASALASAPAVATAQPAPPPSIGLDVDASYLAARQRTLERQIARQKQTVRMLVILLVLAFAVAGVSGIIAYQKNRPAPSTGGGGLGGTIGETRESDGAVDGVTKLPPGGTGGVVDGGSEVADDGDTAHPGTPGSTPPGAGAAPGDPGGAGVDGSPPGNGDAPVDSPFLVEVEQARALARQSENADLDLDERIKAMKQAIDILKRVLASSPESERPADLPELIAAYERALKKLELKKFFP